MNVINSYVFNYFFNFDWFEKEDFDQFFSENFVVNWKDTIDFNWGKIKEKCRQVSVHNEQEKNFVYRIYYASLSALFLDDFINRQQFNHDEMQNFPSKILGRLSRDWGHAFSEASIQHGKIIGQIVEYLSINQREIKVDKIQKGVCHGLSLLFAHDFLLLNENAFFSRLQEFLHKRVSLDEETVYASYVEYSAEDRFLESFISDILALQDTHVLSSQLKPLEALVSLSSYPKAANFLVSFSRTTYFQFDRKIQGYPELVRLLQDLQQSDKGEKKVALLSIGNHAAGIAFDKYGRALFYNINESFRMNWMLELEWLSNYIMHSLKAFGRDCTLFVRVISLEDLPETRELESYYLKQPLNHFRFKPFNGYHPAVVCATKGEWKQLETFAMGGMEMNVFGAEGKETPLLFALSCGAPFKTIQVLVECGADPLIGSTFLGNSFEVASARGDVEILKYLISVTGFSVTQVSPKGNTLLHFVRTQEMLVYLLGQGLSVNFQNQEGITPFHAAFFYEYRALYSYYLFHPEVDLLLKDGCGETALFYAVKNGDFSLVQTLVEMGLDLEAVDDKGSTLLHCVGSRDVFEYLIEKGLPINAENKEGNTPLMVALQRGNRDLYPSFFAHSECLFDVKNSKGVNPLMLATMHADLEAVRFFLDQGIDPTQYCCDLENALSIAITKGFQKIFEVLVNYSNENPFSVDINEKNLLHFAVDCQNFQALELLLEKGVSPLEQNFEGVSPLEMATKNGFFQGVKACVSRDLKLLNFLNREGLGLIHIMARLGNVEGVKWLEEQGLALNQPCFNGKKPLYYSLEADSSNAFLYLIERESPIDWMGKEGKALMFRAAILGRVEIFSIIEREGVPLQTPIKRGKTALDYAVWYNHVPLIDKFLNWGFSVDTQDAQGNTLLMNALVAQAEDVIRYLLQQGASLSIKNLQGQTVRDIAQEEGYKLF